MTEPQWSARPYTESDREAVLALFTEPDFYFRTWRPDTRPEWELLELLDEDVRVLLADGEPVGLYAVETVGAEHAAHCSLRLRLAARAPLAWWASAYREIERALRWRREVVRLTVPVGEFDERGLAAARASGLHDDGTLTELMVHQGERAGQVFFSRIWEPVS